MNFNAIRELVNPKTVIDIGANTGWFASCLGKVCPKAEITMIEANPNCEDMLSEIGYPYAIAALSNKSNNKVKFYINKDDKVCCGASLYKEDTKFYENCVEIEVETHTLDEGELYVESGVDLLKIDVQGSEKDILEGALETLKRTKNILLECSFSNFNVGSPQIEEVVEFVKQHEFYPKVILEEHWSRPGIDLPVRVVHQIDVLFSKIPDDGNYVSCENEIKKYRETFDSSISEVN